MPEKLSLARGEVYLGWEYLGITALPKKAGLPSTHVLSFQKGDKKVLVANGQAIGLMMCLTNGVVTICPDELQIFTRGIYTNK